MTSTPTPTATFVRSPFRSAVPPPAERCQRCGAERDHDAAFGGCAACQSWVLGGLGAARAEAPAAPASASAQAPSPVPDARRPERFDPRRCDLCGGRILVHGDCIACTPLGLRRPPQLFRAERLAATAAPVLPADATAQPSGSRLPA